MSQPLISTIVATYNRRDYLPETIDSILAQDYEPQEIIVIDDGSTDDTKAVLEQYGERLLYIFQENQGVNAARNHGVRAARGEFLAFLDSDDLWVPEKLAQQMAVFFDRPETDAVYGHAEQFYSPEMDEAYRSRIHRPEGAQPAIVTSSLLIRRSSFLEVGYLDETIVIGSDMEWYSRQKSVGLNMCILPDVLFRRRLHQTNLSLTHENVNAERLRTIKLILNRKREAK